MFKLLEYACPTCGCRDIVISTVEIVTRTYPILGLNVEAEMFVLDKERCDDLHEYSVEDVYKCAYCGKVHWKCNEEEAAKYLHPYTGNNAILSNDINARDCKYVKTFALSDDGSDTPTVTMILKAHKGMEVKAHPNGVIEYVGTKGSQP